MSVNYSALNPASGDSFENPVLQPALYKHPELLNRSEYWDSYYGSGKKSPPSQFAAFIAGEFPDHSLVIDVGCGNGRDTVFFAQLGFHTIGVDGSKSAIDHCKSLMPSFDRSPSSNIFVQRDVIELGISKEDFGVRKSVKKIIYARFFLHAINSLEEKSFLSYAFSVLNSGDVFSLEFRTSHDESRIKETGKHYRRYIDVSDFVREVTVNYGAKVLYLAEGSGFAKYKNDDAHVCRIILAKG